MASRLYQNILIPRPSGKGALTDDSLILVIHAKPRQPRGVCLMYLPLHYQALVILGKGEVLWEDFCICVSFSLKSGY